MEKNQKAGMNAGKALFEQALITVGGTRTDWCLSKASSTPWEYCDVSFEGATSIVRVGVSAGGVVSIDGHPFTPDRELRMNVALDPVVKSLATACLRAGARPHAGLVGVIELAVENLRVGDRVDLASCQFLKDKPFAEFEYAVVESAERETPSCVAIGYEDIDVVGYPLGTKLKVVMNTPDALSRLYQLWDRLRDIPTIENDDGISCLDVPFENFSKGTPCEDVWHWFEAQHPQFVVGEVMQGIRHA